MENKYYIYAHINPVKGEVFYIGKGCAGRANSKSHRTKHWHSVVNKYCYEVLFIEKDLTEEQAIVAEIIYIELFGREDQGKGTLINHTDGGDGISGYKHTEESCKKMSESKKGQVAHNKGIPMSYNQKKLLSKIRTGKKASDETKNKMRIRMIGNKYTLGISPPNKGKKMPDEVKFKQSEAAKKRIRFPISEETKLKIGFANKKRWSERKLAVKNNPINVSTE